MYQDTDLDPEREERLRQEERDAELARRIRREVLRVQSGEADELLEADREREEAERSEREKAERLEYKRSRSLLRGFFNGNVITREWLAGHYRYPFIIAGIFMLSIFVMYWAFRLDLRYSRLDNRVQLLRERSIRLQEQRYRQTTHSAIVRRIEERGLGLRDPAKPGMIIED